MHPEEVWQAVAGATGITSSGLKLLLQHVIYASPSQVLDGFMYLDNCEILDTLLPMIAALWEDHACIAPIADC